jgi:hypothetical protein
MSSKHLARFVEIQLSWYPENIEQTSDLMVVIDSIQVEMNVDDSRMN